MIRKVETEYKEHLKTWRGRDLNKVIHTVIKNKTTWWFLFIPIYSYETIEKTQI